MLILIAGVVPWLAQPTLVSGMNIEVTSTSVGDPTWTNTDFHLFSAPADTFEAFIGVISSVWPLHGIGDGGTYSPHEPPYDMETADGMAANGFQDMSTFQVENISGDPLGVYILWTTIPNPGGPTGSSRDFASGPIIPNELMPIGGPAEMLHGGSVVDSAHWGVDEAEGVDGRSHVVSVFGTAAFFFPEGTELLGDYEFQLSGRDAMGNGWDHTLSFEVVPEPSTAALALIGSVFMLARRRKRA